MCPSHTRGNGPVAPPTLDPDPAAVARDDALHQCQPSARAQGIPPHRAELEDAEELVLVARIEPGTGCRARNGLLPSLGISRTTPRNENYGAAIAEKVLARRAAS